MKFLLVIVLLIPSTVYGQTDDHKLIDTISYISVAANLTLDTINSLQSEDRTNALKNQAIRTSITIGTSELLKRIIHETRPDLSDDMSWPSEHSALSCVSVNVRDGKKFAVEFPVAFLTMFGRVKAHKHYWWDVLSGCGIGIAAGFIVQ